MLWKKNAVSREPASRKSARPPRRYCQTTNAAGCLVRVLGHHGVVGDVANIVGKLDASVSDNDVINFLDVAEQFGLFGHPIVLTLAEWRTIPPASILHWGSDSLVVLLDQGQDSATIYDPVHGERQIGLAEFRRQFTGVVLVFNATDKRLTAAQGEKP